MTVSRRTFVAGSVSAFLATGLTPTSAAGAPLPAEPAYRIPVSPDDTAEDLVRKASQVRPTPRQIAWQALERTAFLHFGVNTFTGLEWGTGDEDVDGCRPTGLDTDQWARSLRDGDFGLVALNG